MTTTLADRFCFSLFLECIPQKCSVRSKLVRCCTYLTSRSSPPSSCACRRRPSKLPQSSWLPTSGCLGAAMTSPGVVGLVAAMVTPGEVGATWWRLCRQPAVCLLALEAGLGMGSLGGNCPFVQEGYCRYIRHMQLQVQLRARNMPSGGSGSG
jgi:hypothetical protein